MSTEFYFPSRTSQRWLRVGPLAGDLDRFATRLKAQGYARPSAVNRLRLVSNLSRWLEHQGLGVVALDEPRRAGVPGHASGGDDGQRGDDAGAAQRRGVAASGHGFRSSFKGWARQHDVNELLSEFALAHVEGSATVAAYARDDLLEKRRPVMQAWADCISG